MQQLGTASKRNPDAAANACAELSRSEADPNPVRDVSVDQGFYKVRDKYPNSKFEY